MTTVLRQWSQRQLQAGKLIPHLIWVTLAVLLLWVTFRSVDLDEVWERLLRLEPQQIALLLVVNLAVLATFSARWWLLLYAQGYKIPYFRLITYRLATFAVSYFTPGPHFGGEPLQVYLVSSRHGVPVSASVAAVLVDKVLEMTVNFIFLTLGVLFVVQAQALVGISEEQLLLSSLALLTLPLSLLIALFLGMHPLSALLAMLDRLRRQWAVRRGKAEGLSLDEMRLWRAIRQSEEQSIALCRDHPVFLLLAIGASLLSWAAIIGEFWLMTNVLGLNLALPEAITALLAARVAILLPMPAAIGALEASQALAMRILGQSPAAGVSLSLLIRGRDLLLGIVGLWLAGALVWKGKRQGNSGIERLGVE
jgi:glycosyltransferase 2 family protein